MAQSKNRRPRYIPLSSFALESFLQLPRYVDVPWIFAQPDGSPWRNPRGPFQRGRANAGLDWVRGFHDLRHFRATMWLQQGVDVHTVQRYLGHQGIETTMRYLHFVEDYAERSLREAQRAEQEMIRSIERGRQMGDKVVAGGSGDAAKSP